MKQVFGGDSPVFSMDFFFDSDGKESAGNAGDLGSISGVGKISWRREHPLEKGTATHSSILAWIIPWTEEPGRLQSMGVAKSWTWLSDVFFMIQWVLATWSLVPLPFLNPACTSGSSQFMYYWSLASSFDSVSFGVTDPFLWDLVNARFCLCPPRLEAIFTQVLWKSCNQIPLAFKIRFPGNSQSLCWVPGWEAWYGVKNLHNSWSTYLVLLFSSLSVTHPVCLGFDFVMTVPLLLSHWSFFFVFEHGVSFLVVSSVLLLMVVQHLVLILVFSQEEMNTCLSTLPSWTRSYYISDGLIYIARISKPFSIPCLIYQHTIQASSHGDNYRAPNATGEGKSQCAKYIQVSNFYHASYYSIGLAWIQFGGTQWGMDSGRHEIIGH